MFFFSHLNSGATPHRQCRGGNKSWNGCVGGQQPYSGIERPRIASQGQIMTVRSSWALENLLQGWETKNYQPRPDYDSTIVKTAHLRFYYGVERRGIAAAFQTTSAGVCLLLIHTHAQSSFCVACCILDPRAYVFTASVDMRRRKENEHVGNTRILHKVNTVQKSLAFLLFFAVYCKIFLKTPGILILLPKALEKPLKFVNIPWNLLELS